MVFVADLISSHEMEYHRTKASVLRGSEVGRIGGQFWVLDVPWLAQG